MKEIKTTFSDDTLEATPARTLIFLRAVGTVGAIWAELHGKGYTKADHEEGWTLLHKVSGKAAPLATPPESTPAREATKELELWGKEGFPLISSTLARRHPSQCSFVFNGLGPPKGAKGVLTVKTVLDRLDALDHGPERKATRKEDHAALQSIVPRGIDKAERARLRALVLTAEQAADKAEAPDPAAVDQATEEMKADLTALKAWFDEWSGVAKVVIKRRDYLIRLGLAKRKKSKKEKPSEPPPDKGSKTG